ncbi:TPA: hypothetical protein QCX68_001622 [Bacillus wiedmannii]|nr:hypothetical protein [Bacillus wiedmannii]
MVHTGMFYVELSEEQKYKMEERFNTTILLINSTIQKQFKGITTYFKKREGAWLMYIIVDFIELLSRENGVIVEEDYGLIREKIKEVLYFLFSDNEVGLTLLRIDYRYDIVIKNQKHREYLFFLYKKLTKKYRHQKRCNRKKGSNQEYKTTMYFNSKSINGIIYDKERERLETKTDIKEYERDVLRFEIRLQNKHLLNMRSKNGIQKTLKDYLKKGLWEKYMNNYMKNIIYEGDYYSIYHAEKIINSSSLKDKEKVKLRQFLCDISRYGVDGVKQWKEENKNKKHTLYTEYLFKKYLGYLRAFNINPVLLPKNNKLNLGAEKKIKNPFNI